MRENCSHSAKLGSDISKPLHAFTFSENCRKDPPGRCSVFASSILLSCLRQRPLPGPHMRPRSAETAWQVTNRLHLPPSCRLSRRLGRRSLGSHKSIRTPISLPSVVIPCLPSNASQSFGRSCPSCSRSPTFLNAERWPSSPSWFIRGCVNLLAQVLKDPSINLRTGNNRFCSSMPC